MTELQSALRPQYAKRFECIGSRCEDTCCSTWSVPVDRQSFETYKALPPGPLQALFEQKLLITITPSSTRHPERDHGRIQLDSNGNCPFLSVDRLCRIQTEYGAALLCHTCAVYPRRTRVLDGAEETSLELSCPEASRLVLLDPRFMPLAEDGTRGAARYTQFLHDARGLDPATGDPLQYLWPMRHLLLLVLKDRSYPLWQRLFVVGILCQRLAQSGASGAGSVPQLLAGYAEMLQQERLRGAMDAIPANPERQIGLALELIEHRAGMTAMPARLLECIVDFCGGLNHRFDRPPAQAVAAYQKADAAYFQPLLAQHEHVFENYLIWSVLRRRFPFGDELLPDTVADASTEFSVMAMEFAMLKVLGIGMAARYRESFGLEHVVKLVQSFSKGFEHNLAVRKAILEFVGRNQLNSTQNLATMLRN